MIPISKAFDLIKANLQPLPRETVTLEDCVGRVLANDVCSDVHSPPHDKSMMDGFAVRCADICGPETRLSVIETIAAGGWPENELSEGQAARIMTGAPLPVGADAIVMIEDTEFDDSEATVQIKLDSLEHGKHLMRKSANIKVGQTVFQAGHTIRATDVGLLAETGNVSVEVYSIPTISVLPTGDELVDCSETPERGQIRNSNGPMLTAMVSQLGFDVSYLGIGRDEPAELERLVAEGLQNDILLLSGGVSMGEFDLVPGVLAKAGVKQVFHKVAVKPGKPIWFGILEKDHRNSYVFGLPGNPVSSLVGFHLFVRTAIRCLMGASEVTPSSVAATLSIPHEARGGRPTYWPSKWVPDETTERKIAPLPWRGSSDLVALGQAEALTYFEAGTKTHPAGQTVRVFPL